MYHQYACLLTVLVLLLAVMIIVPSENFGYTRYTNYKAPPVTDGPIQTCSPSDGQWSSIGTGDQGRSTLLSPCCQPPMYQLADDKQYKTCTSIFDPNNPIDTCIAHCCDYVNSEEKKGPLSQYDTSWFPMARCACSLWCNNQDVPHFRKYGTAVHYISGDIAEASTSDLADFIGSERADSVASSWN